MPEKCRKCGQTRPDVEVRYSFNVYAGVLCRDCCLTFRDHCGIDQPQGRPEDLDEVFRGGADAYYGEEDG